MTVIDKVSEYIYIYVTNFVLTYSSGLIWSNLLYSTLHMLTDVTLENIEIEL